MASLLATLPVSSSLVSLQFFQSNSDRLTPLSLSLSIHLHVQEYSTERLLMQFKSYLSLYTPRIHTSTTALIP